MKRENKIKKLFANGHNRGFLVYLVSFLAIVVALALTYQEPNYENFASKIQSSKIDNTNQTATLNPVTEVGLALGAAENADLPIVNQVTERASSLVMKQQMAQNEDQSISKTIVDINNTNPAIRNYTTVTGDSVPVLAREFGISEQTIKWANNLTTNDLSEGKQLILPTVDGVVYKVREGDTIESIIEKYGSDRKQILETNNIDDITVGDKIVLPGGTLPEDERPGYVRPGATYANTSSVSSGSISSGSLSGSWLGIDPSVNVGNAYAFGNCTYYAYNRRAQLGRPVGSFWGNANTWAMAARAAGYTVNGIPAPGAVFQTAAGGYGYGHVGIVESVNDDGTITVSDMNAICGYNCVGTARWDRATWSQYNYIH